MGRCLYCYKELTENERDFHSSCAKRFFGTVSAPELPYSLNDLDGLAAKVIKSQTTLTGVQAKLSLNLERHEGLGRLTVVGLWGAFIFKPQTLMYRNLPENEDLTMHLAETAKIRTVPHSLIRLADGTLGYLAKRIDRDDNGEKIAMEDMCQLTERPTEYKYRSSYEQVAKTISRYSDVPLLDLTEFYETVLFCYLVGNNDMHLKNFSLYEPDGKWRLAPAYDLLNVKMANPKDTEELALTLNAKKKNVRKRDFAEAMSRSGIPVKVLDNFLTKYNRLLPAFNDLVERSFLPEDDKNEYKSSIASRLERLAKDSVR